MPVSRRGFLHLASAPPTCAPFLAARGLEAHLAEAQRNGGAPPLLPARADEIRISSNENPLGPGKAVLDAIVREFPEAGRYPFNSTPNEGALAAAIAAKYKAKPEHIVLGAGSQELLKSAVRAFTTRARGLLTASPSFENCPSTARKLGHPVVEIQVDAALRIDLEPMIAASKEAGLIFFNNPNNPTATVHGAKAVAEFVSRVRKQSPDTVILIDEAYHDYVTDPSYESAIPLALATPNVIVTRTLSKAYGMAGMRIGYAIGRAETIKPLATLKMPYNVSVLSIAAAMAALGDPKHINAERARNTDVRAFTAKALSVLGCTSTESQSNFVFTDIHQPAKEFRDACAKHGVMVGRDFPPFEKTHVRISIGTMEEMQKALLVFRSVLNPETPQVARRQADAPWR